MRHAAAETGRWAFALFVVLPIALIVMAVLALFAFALVAQVPAMTSELYHSLALRIAAVLLVIAFATGSLLDKRS